MLKSLGKFSEESDHAFTRALTHDVYDGWDGYQTSLVHAIAPLSREQLAWRPAPHLT